MNLYKTKENLKLVVVFICKISQRLKLFFMISNPDDKLMDECEWMWMNLNECKSEYKR